MWKSRRRKKREEEAAKLAERMNRPVGEGPTGVWCQYSDGQRYEPLPTIYVGRSEDGIDQYEVLLPRSIDDDRPTAFGAERWPGLTGMSIPIPRGYRPIVTEENPDGSMTSGIIPDE